jgi:hypothetical protein
MNAAREEEAKLTKQSPGDSNTHESLISVKLLIIKDQLTVSFSPME